MDAVIAHQAGPLPRLRRVKTAGRREQIPASETLPLGDLTDHLRHLLRIVVAHVSPFLVDRHPTITLRRSGQQQGRPRHVPLDQRYEGLHLRGKFRLRETATERLVRAKRDDQQRRAQSRQPADILLARIVHVHRPVNPDRVIEHTGIPVQQAEAKILITERGVRVLHRPEIQRIRQPVDPEGVDRDPADGRIAP